VEGDAIEPLREPPVRGIEQHDGAVVVRLGGELDLYNADEIRHALAGAIDGGAGRIVVDMADVDFVDSTALGVLVEARSKLGHDGLLLAAPQIETRRTLEVSGLDRHLLVHDSVDSALAVPH
jgi:anti-sigma B factor antagonist